MAALGYWACMIAGFLAGCIWTWWRNPCLKIVTNATIESNPNIYLNQIGEDGQPTHEWLLIRKPEDSQ